MRQKNTDQINSDEVIEFGIKIIYPGHNPEVITYELDSQGMDSAAGKIMAEDLKNLQSKMIQDRIDENEDKSKDNNVKDN